MADATKPAELLLYEYLGEKIAQAVHGDPLFEIELHDTVYQPITKLRGVRISDSISTPAPDIGGGVKEYDLEVQIVCFVRVESADQKKRAEALQKVFEIQTEVCGLLFDDASLGGRVCDSFVGTSIRAYDRLDGNPYAVANIPLTINPSGEQ